MNFLRKQQESLALRLIIRQYRKQQVPLPAPGALARQAVETVAQAHAIARERGRNVLGILKELLENIKAR